MPASKKDAGGGRKASPPAVAPPKKKYGVEKVGAWEQAAERTKELIRERRADGYAVLAVIFVPSDEIRPAIMVAAYKIEDEAQVDIIRKAATNGS